MRSLLIPGLFVALLTPALPAQDLFGLVPAGPATPGFDDLAAGPEAIPVPTEGVPADDLARAEELLARAVERYWEAISGSISRVQCGDRGSTDRGDQSCRFTVGSSDWGSADEGEYKRRQELMGGSEEDLAAAHALLAAMVTAAREAAPPEPTDAAITRSGRLVAALKGCNDMLDRATRTELARHRRLWFDKTSTYFATPLERFDVRGLVAHLDPAAFSGGTPEAGRGDVDALVEDLRSRISGSQDVAQAYMDAVVADRYAQYRAARGVGREELGKVCVAYEAILVGAAPVVARLRYELEARGLATESRDPWTVIGDWEQRVNRDTSRWITWTRWRDYEPVREDAQVVWHFLPPAYQGGAQDQPPRITDRWMPYGVDNGWVGGLGETRPTPPSS